MKKILIIILFILLSTNSFADKKFEKDLKKISKDNFNSPKDYSMFKNLTEVKFVNITSSECKKKATLGGYHGLALTECFADEDPKSKEIKKYLEEIY